MLERNPWLRFLPLLLALLIFLILLLISPGLALAAAVVLGAAAVWLMRQIDAILRRLQAADALDSDRRTPESVDQLPSSPDFHLGEPGKDPAPTRGAVDSVEAVKFKESLRNLYAVDAAERTIGSRYAATSAAASPARRSRLAPGAHRQPRVLGSIAIPGRIREQMVEDFGEVMVYPEIDCPCISR